MDTTFSTTLLRILDEAKKEFMAKGYQKASLRNIVKQAGLTTGAFYGYFKNKEQLFDALVGKQYNDILNMYNDRLNQFFNLTPEEQMNNMVNITYECMIQLKDYMYDNYDAVKMILTCSEGTKYKDLVHHMAEMDTQATRDFAKSMGSVSCEAKPVNPILEHILTSGMFAGYFELIIHDVKREDADEYINQLLEFYSAGWGKIMGF